MASNRKPKKMLIQFALALLVAVVLGGGAVIVGITLITTVSKNADQTKQEAEKKAAELAEEVAQLQRTNAMRNAGQTYPIVQAGMDIPPGKKITPDMLMTVQSRELPQPGTIKQVSQAIGKMVRAAVDRGQVLTSSQLIDSERWLQVPDGYRAITIKVDMDGGVSTSLAQDSKVDVLVTVEAETGGLGSGAKNHLTRTVLQNVPVIGVASVGGPSANGVGTRKSSVTLLVTPTQAEMLALAGEVGIFHLTLRNQADVQTANSSVTDIQKLLGLSSPKPPAKKQTPKAIVSRPSDFHDAAFSPDANLPVPGSPEYNRTHFSMKILRGTGSETVEFKK